MASSASVAASSAIPEGAGIAPPIAAPLGEPDEVALDPDDGAAADPEEGAPCPELCTPLDGRPLLALDPDAWEHPIHARARMERSDAVPDALIVCMPFSGRRP